MDTRLCLTEQHSGKFSRVPLLAFSLARRVARLEIMSQQKGVLLPHLLNTRELRLEFQAFIWNSRELEYLVLSRETM